MKLKEIAHARTGDKGEISNISVIPYDENNYEMLKEKVTETRVASHGFVLPNRVLGKARTDLYEFVVSQMGH